MLHKVALNVYNRPWLIEPQSALNLLRMWERIMKGETTYMQERDQEEKADPLQQFKQLFAKSGVVIAPENVRQAQSFQGFEGANVAIIPVNGPLMKADFCGWFGTATLASLVKLADQSSTVKSILLVIDSPGGTVDGTATFAETIARSRKQTTAVIDGMCCSAAYWIGSSAQEIVSTSKTDIIGSIGTMMGWWNTDEADKKYGAVYREYYATASRDKNRAFNEADQGDGRRLVEEMLDPMNNEFLQAVKQNRRGKLNMEKENVLTGKTYLSAQAKEYGLIDNITSFDKVLSRALQAAKTIVK